MANTVDQQLFKYFGQLNDAEKKSLLQMVKTFLKGKELVGHISIEQYNLELANAESQIYNGQSTSQEDLEKEIQKW